MPGPTGEEVTLATATKKPTRELDLNKLRAARFEAKGEGPTVKFGKNTFTCPPEVPFMVVEAFGRMESAEENASGFEAATAILDAVRRLIGDDQYAKFMAEDPSTEDIVEFLTGIMNLYGVEPGESPASPES